MAACVLIPLAVPQASTAAKAAPCGETVQVGLGDTLAAIARRCDVEIPALLKANRTIRDPNVIPLGAELTIPGAAGDGARAEPAGAISTGAGPRRHVIAPGDTLSSIARRHRIDVADMIAANPDVDPGFLAVGATLRLPGAAGSYSASTGEPETAQIQVEPSAGPPGARVTLSASGLAPDERVLVGGGTYGGSHLILRRSRTDAEGRLDVSLRIPAWASDEKRFGFVVEMPRKGLVLRSGPVTIASPEPSKPQTSGAGGAQRKR